MKKTYLNPEIEILEFDMKDVITTSGDPLDGLTPDGTNTLDGWTDFY